MRDTSLHFPEPLRAFLRDAVERARGNEVYFLGRVSWADGPQGREAKLEEVDVLARGNEISVPAIIDHAEEWDVAIHNHPSGRLEPSAADMAVAGELARRGVGFAIISNDAERHHLVTGPYEPRQFEPLDPEEVARIFSPGGPLSASVSGFEARGGQIEMALAVTRALNEDRVLAAEAGTGVGKSFAYLVPAILWAVKNRAQVVVSTGTINLQEQLISKDLPLLDRVLEVEFTFALAKGRGNYACRRKVEELAEDLEQGEIPGVARERDELRSLVEWARAARDGSRSELPWNPSPHAWEEVMSETDKSLKASCPHHARCFYYEAKRRASRADIVVVNHHLYFADLALRRASGNYSTEFLIPPAGRVIFDEAHRIEDAAAEHFGATFSRPGILSRLARLRSPRDPKRGVIPMLARKLRGLNAGMTASAIERAFEGAVEEARIRVTGACARIEDALLDAVSEEAAGEEGTSSIKLRYRADPRLESFWDLAREELQGISEALQILLAVNERALSALDRAPIPEEALQPLLLEPNSFKTRTEALIGDIGLFSNYAGEEHVRWIERGENGPRRGDFPLEFTAAPIRVSGILKESLFDRARTAVLTSATLSASGSIGFLAERLGLDGLDKGRFVFTSHASPFDFERQVLTVVPSDFPFPDARDHEVRLREALHEILRATGGRAFVLFTSYALLRRTYEALAPRLRALGLLPAAQGEADRSQLLERFKAGAHNVLFGTDSFWEGVDVKGRALECVIITRLPFRVPTEPLQEARSEEIKARGGNDFLEFTVPQAVLKFKQGFGRLIRSQEDRGIVAILDRRIRTKRYGQLFLESLPRTRFLHAPLAGVIAAASEFFAGPEARPDPAPPREEAPAPGRPIAAEREFAAGPEAPREPGPPW